MTRLRWLGVAVLILATSPVALAIESATTTSLEDRLEQLVDKPSVHEDREAIDRALRAAGVGDGEILALHHAVAQANLPTMAGSLDAFLFFTQEPRWQRYRRHFAEFLELPDLFTIDAATMTLLADYDGVLTLPAITELSPKMAAACRFFGQGGWGAALEFPNVSVITPEAAKQLARCEALLVFPHLRELSLEAAQMLAKTKGTGLILGGLTTLPADVADALSVIQTERGLLLPDLTSLDSVPLAKRFAKQDHAFFPAVRHMTPEIARALRSNDGGELSLPSLETVTPELAREFVGAGYYWLVLGGAATLTSEVTGILAKHHGQLVFPGHDTLSAEAAAKLAVHEHGIILPHVASVPAEVLNALAPHDGPLVLGSVSTLTQDEAAAIAHHGGLVSLPVLDRLTPEMAAILAPRIGHIELPAITSLDAKTAAALAAHAEGEILLEGLTDLPPDVAAALATTSVSLAFPALTELSVEAARALAPHRGLLMLHVNDDVGPDLVAGLATHAGDLCLAEITTLSADLGKLLASVPGRLSLPSVTSIEAEAASALLARTKPVEFSSLVHIEQLDSTAVAKLIVKHFEDVELPGVTSLTGPDAVAIAEILTQARGSLALPSLERISPRALEVLLARPGIQLPEVASLKLIREPGQLGHDDFVAPKP
jgi:hypothetical protein